MGDWKITEPTVLGHEASGVVTQIGSKVTNVHVGDEVALEPNDFCGFCHACIVGDNQLCQVTIDNPIRDLYLQQYATLSARMCTKLPAGQALRFHFANKYLLTHFIHPKQESPWKQQL
jgi:Zn-dependent alcohol dehydrogenase